MSLGISYLGKGVRIAAEKELLSSSESHKKTKKQKNTRLYSVPEAATPMT